MTPKLLVDQPLQLGFEEELTQVRLQLQVVDRVGHLEVHEHEGDGLLGDHEVLVELLEDGFETLRGLNRPLVQADMHALVDEDLVLMVAWASEATGYLDLVVAEGEFEVD